MLMMISGEYELFISGARSLGLSGMDYKTSLLLLSIKDNSCFFIFTS